MEGEEKCLDFNIKYDVIKLGLEILLHKLERKASVPIVLWLGNEHYKRKARKG
jgi:hypothetical protein